MVHRFIVLIGIYVLAWGLLYEGGDDVWDYMAITGAILLGSLLVPDKNREQ